MIRHMVFVRFRPEVEPEDRAALLAELGGLSERLDGISDFQVRRNVSPEAPVVRGFDDMFWFDFADEAARDAYLADAGHRALGSRLVSAAEDGRAGIFVCDIEP